MFFDHLHAANTRKRLTIQIDKLERLLVDLRGLKSGALPKPHVMRAAPVLETYQVIYIGSPALTGRVTGHPEIEGDRSPMVSSQLMVFLAEHGIARTMSRWYRLGSRTRR